MKTAEAPQSYKPYLGHELKYVSVLSSLSTKGHRQLQLKKVKHPTFGPTQAHFLFRTPASYHPTFGSSPSLSHFRNQYFEERDGIGYWNKLEYALNATLCMMR